MKRSSLGGILALAGLAGVMLIRCTEVTVDRDANGNTTAVAGGPDVPPVLIDRDGVHEPPTPTPDTYQPVYPITPPPPTATPRSR
jgi:hypothetical protein